MTGAMMAIIGDDGGSVPAGAFSVKALPFVAFAAGQTSPAVTATVTGGTGPFVYNWTTDNPAVFPDTPNADTTTFSTNSGEQNLASSSRCTVEDDTGAFVSSNNVAVKLNQGA